MAGELVQHYYQAVQGILASVFETQAAVIGEAGRLGAAAIKGGGLVHVFGTGHSHLIAEEVVDRAGGLLLINAILEPSLMLHEGVKKSSSLERLPGMAERLLSLQPLKAGDLFVVVSNSGRNAVPVEAALYAQARGLKVAAITSVAHSRSQTPTHAGGKRLFEIADLVIDNGGVPGDAILEVPGSDVRACATSTVAGAFIIQSVIAAIIENLGDLQTELPVLASGNVDGSQVHNERVLRCYQDRLAQLRTYMG
ncbi:MAG TPA: SIS domain-containing protein [Symbiobacteriaceae bacterium]|jgi:uncharacterized phosphosugar-binding protein